MFSLGKEKDLVSRICFDFPWGIGEVMGGGGKEGKINEHLLGK